MVHGSLWFSGFLLFDCLEGFFTKLNREEAGSTAVQSGFDNIGTKKIVCITTSTDFPSQRIM